MKVSSVPTMQQLINSTTTLCSPPLVYQRLDEAINHPRTTMQQIARIISEDQGLTARLLKLANSPLFGFSKVDTIQRAVTLLGTREIRDLALAVTLVKRLRGIDIADAQRLKNHWRHSISCAVVARNIAFYLREPGIERFFVAGILHNIGRLILCLRLPHEVEAAFNRGMTSDLPLHLIEQEMFGFDHAALGRQLLETWNLPTAITRMVSWHHQPTRTYTCGKDAAVIHLADLICQALGWGPDPDVPMIPLDAGAWDLLTIPVRALDAIISQSEPQLIDIMKILEVES